ncbi:MAG: hypothetical protein ABFC62_11525 [Clostridiaceae bacterium]
MEAPAQPKKKRSAGKIIFWVLFTPVLIVLLTALLAFATLSLYGFQYGDHQALLAAAPMGARERYAFHANERTADVSLDAADLTCLLSQEGVADPAALENKLKEGGIDLAAYGVHLESYGFLFNAPEDTLSITLLFKGFGFIPIPLRLDMELSVRGNTLNMTLARAYLTRLFALPLEKLGLDASGLSYALDLGSLFPWLSPLRSVSVAGERLVLTYGVGTELFGEIAEDTYFAEQASRYIADIDELNVFLASYNGGKAELGPAFTELISRLEAEPDKIEEVRLNFLSLASTFMADRAFSGDRGVYAARFLPSVTNEAVTDRHAVISAAADKGQASLRSYLDNLNHLYFNGGISYSDTALLDAASGAPLDPSALLEGEKPYGSFLAPGSSRLVLCGGDVLSLAFGFETPLKKLPHPKGTTFPGFEPDQVYTAALLTRAANGSPVLLYLYFNAKGTFIAFDPVAEEDYEARMTSEAVPVFLFGT